MFDPFIQLAFNLHSNPGVFALLLGSGVSRSSGIPTGWEIVLDLIRRVAVLEGEDCRDDPEAWYVERHQERPSYASLIDRLAPTPSLRQQTLRAYFEPTDAEREEGKKVPTAAHKAIAKLAAGGAFRVIITTNFDRLMETALEAEGITPTVIASSDAAQGAVPLVHAPHTLIKLHGDYLDTRIKNSPAELEQYEANINQLLDRIFDEFGLIVCGWSADYDTALRDAITRASSRRYPMFWIARGTPSQAATDLIRFRQASTMPVDSADSFFAQLEEKYEALRQYSEPHPLSKSAAIQTLKRYLSDSTFDIRLQDLVLGEAKKAQQAINDIGRRNVNVGFDVKDFSSRLHGYENATSTLRGLFILATYWYSKRNERVFRDVFNGLIYSDLDRSGLTCLINLRLYPGLIIRYCIGIAAVLSQKFELFNITCGMEYLNEYTKDDMARLLVPQSVVDSDAANHVLNQKIGGEPKKYHTPASQYISDAVYEDFANVVLSKHEYVQAFDKYEYIASLVYLDHLLLDKDHGRDWLPVGAYRWRSWGDRGQHNVAVHVNEELDKLGSEWPPLRAGLFGGDLSRVRDVIDNANKWLSSNFRMWG